MTDLSLRLRVFLFFCLIGLGGVAIILIAVQLGFRQLDDPEAFSAFATVAIGSTFGLLALATFVWRLFDENVSKPIERLAAQFRLCASDVSPVQIDPRTAKYLGDLAPAAFAVNRKLGQVTQASTETVAQRTARLEQHRSQLLTILSDVPVAVIVATQDHQIVLYDGQAADLMEREAPARLNGSLFDYLEESAIRDVLSKMHGAGTPRQEIAVNGRSGAVYSGHIRLFDGQTGYTLMLHPLEPDAARPLVYDFDLFDQPRPTDPDDTALRDLTFVVFDGETTGLNPAKDDVVQLGAVRIVNGRMVPGEVFDTLVNPGRPIPATSTKVHGITDDMVATAPDFTDVCQRFHHFARDAVIVAHNAPFDMAFLHREAGKGGVTFDNPILDTVHLSAVIFGGSANHTLDALCDRLSIVLPGNLRHTALGDATATAEALVALLPVLEARGIGTFGQVRAEMQKHSRILKLQD
ncbi:3'-5' exonuclease [Actibacterium sp. 188UL27-1]|uniref:3'-5' exonuclease n=1 Tax=Actibacterium sp. 188UL27-1 TaxID=2786961 RepID=UPI001956DFE1|nr:3'-5' exonuclease [Actibacterium sp. 188UL27-1]MBM7068716.1 3'-5' exonuclease [Actibacterium sp. 188UL27-1]